MSEQRRRVLAVGLDAFEISLFEQLACEGRLPHIKQLADQAARFRLHHDDRAKFTGLAWEHFSTGRGPEDQQRWSAVTFDPLSYSVAQPQTGNEPFVANLSIPTVVFDAPYFDLEKAPNVLGVTSWGAHDPGTEAFSRPSNLRDEVAARFGEYPAPEWIYGFSWPSIERTKAAGDALRNAVNVRKDITRWLLAERVAEWQLAIVVVSESHSAIEQFWHGMDHAHPLNQVPSAESARAALVGVYEAIDDLVGDLVRSFPDATIVLFSMHGMGENKSDLPAMFLVPELLYRHAFGHSYAKAKSWSAHLSNGVPIFRTDEEWEKVMRDMVPWPTVAGTTMARLRRLFGGRRPLPGRAQAGNLGWMPAARYAAFWSRMPAFALPAYYDAWVRLNLMGREAHGLVAKEDYDQVRQEICDLLSECRDPVSGRAVIENIAFPNKAPYDIGPTEADIYVSFVSGTTGLRHERLGTVGPMPYRRTGGHTGDWGFLFVKANEIGAGDRGIADSFDVVPTLIDLLGARANLGISGRSLARRLS